MAATAYVLRLDAVTGALAFGTLLEKDPLDTLTLTVDAGAYLDAAGMSLSDATLSADAALNVLDWRVATIGGRNARGVTLRVDGGAAGSIAFVGVELLLLDAAGEPDDLVVAVPLRVASRLPPGLVAVGPTLALALVLVRDGSAVLTRDGANLTYRMTP